MSFGHDFSLSIRRFGGFRGAGGATCLGGATCVGGATVRGGREGQERRRIAAREMECAMAEEIEREWEMRGGRGGGR